MSISFKIIAVIAFLLISLLTSATVDDVNEKHNGAYAYYSEGVLKVGNKYVERVWEWTDQGLHTTIVKDKVSSKIYQSCTNQKADWSLLPNMNMHKAELLSVTAVSDDDEGFTEEHIEVVAEIAYPLAKMSVKYKIWCFPEAAGLRTQLFVRNDGNSLANIEYSTGLTKDQIHIHSSTAHITTKVKGAHWTTGHFEQGPQFVPEPASLLDGDIMTFWRTEITKQKPDKPNELILDLGKARTIQSVGIIGPQDHGKVGSPENIIAFVSNDNKSWGSPMASTPFSRSRKEFLLNLGNTKARYIKLLMDATSHANNVNNWASSLSEINVYTDELPYNVIDNLQTDHISLENLAAYKRIFMGYEMDTQFRPTVEFDFYKEAIQMGENGINGLNKWANILCVEKEGTGIMLVKESHKTAVEPGYFTGGFECRENGVALSGWGMAVNEITSEYQECWANWLITYQGEKNERTLALKIFDRQRFPAKLPGHQSINACTWGGGTDSRSNRDLGQEKYVLAELESLADLGIECLGIDDGWQVDKKTVKILPDEQNGWYPHKEVYSAGNWERVQAEAKANNVRLSLWTIAQSISDKELYWNQTNGGFQHWKFDFIDINSYEARAKVQSRIRKFIKEYDHNVGIAWDLTESVPRIGMFWMREYGFLWLANRRRDIESRSVLYRPSNMLKIVWDLSHNINSNKLEVALVDVNQVPAPSDAFLHNMQYAIAIAMTGIPMFFDYTSHYLPETREQIKQILPIYKEHREWMYSSFVFPIGEQPNNNKMTGFQFYKEGKNQGYLILFRELLCEMENGHFKLAFLSNQTIELTNLMTGEKFEKRIGDDGGLDIEIPHPADFRWFKYRIINENR